MAHPPKSGGLVARIAARDEAAFVELYDRMSPRIAGLVRRAVPNSEAAREIVTEVFTRLWREAARLSASGASAEVWLALRARARAVDRLSKGCGLPARALPRLDSLPGAGAWLPDAKVAGLLDEKRNLLGKFLRQLPESQVRLLELAIVYGLTDQEIATKLEEPEGKIKTELRAAFRFMRHRMRTVIGTWTAAI